MLPLTTLSTRAPQVLTSFRPPVPDGRMSLIASSTHLVFLEKEIKRRIPLQRHISLNPNPRAAGANQLPAAGAGRAHVADRELHAAAGARQLAGAGAAHPPRQRLLHRHRRATAAASSSRTQKCAAWVAAELARVRVFAIDAGAQLHRSALEVPTSMQRRIPSPCLEAREPRHNGF